MSILLIVFSFEKFGMLDCRYVEDNLGVMSIGFMLPDPDEAVVWRGPR